MENVSFNKLIGAPTGAVGDLLVPTPVGLERDGEILIRPSAPHKKNRLFCAARAAELFYNHGLHNVKPTHSPPTQLVFNGASTPLAYQAHG